MCELRATILGLHPKGTGSGYYGMLWFDVEQCSGCWYSDLADNAAYLMDGVQEAIALGLTFGIYSSEYEWGITAGTSTAFSSYPLWYAHYDDNPSFSDFVPFAGWTQPNVKLFWDHGRVYATILKSDSLLRGCSTITNIGPSSCSVSVDQNWYPDSMEHPSVRFINSTRSH